ncbi:hypothetical protein D3C72_247390 [compost metagenome]
MSIYTKEQIGKKEADLKSLYKRINEIPEDVDNPGDLARKITLYTMAQGIIGSLYAQSIYEHGHAKVVLKNKRLTLIESYPSGETIKSKEARAEIDTFDLQEAEALARAIAKRWEAAYNQTEQLANALKKELEILNDELRAGGR